MSENERRQQRIIDRRMSRQKRARAWAYIKIALLRIITVITILAFVGAMECILFNRLVLKWALIFIFAVVFTDFMKSIEKKIKVPHGTAIPEGGKHK